MTCSKVQAMVEPFIAEQLNNNEKAEFVRHIRECKNCREELEVYHVIYSVILQLDSDSEVGTEYLKELEEKLSRSESYMKRKKRYRSIMRIVLMLIIALLISILFLLF